MKALALSRIPRRQGTVNTSVHRLAVCVDRSFSSPEAHADSRVSTQEAGLVPARIASIRVAMSRPLAQIVVLCGE
jgi:hypothetical protein